MKNEYGTLCDYKTSNSIRPATEQEWRASREAEKSNIGGGTGVIDVDGMSVYVEGGPELPMDAATLNAIKTHVASVSGEARQDMAVGRWDEVMTDALYAACGATDYEAMSAARKAAQEIASA